MVGWRVEIPVEDARSVYPIPPRYKIVVRRRKLLFMLMREAFRYRFNREIVLSRPCIYGVFSGRLGGFKPDHGKCVACLRCKQEYPEVIKDVLVNPRFKELGDSYVTPDVVWAIDREASTGGDITRGMGYKGPFARTGFDAIWTDMSEIVRPTRHGKLDVEYISTRVDIGRKPKDLCFDGDGFEGAEARLVESSVPILFDYVPEVAGEAVFRRALIKGAERVGNYCILDLNQYLDAKKASLPLGHVIPLVKDADTERLGPVLKDLKVVECEFIRPESFKELRAKTESVIIARLPFTEDVGEEAHKLLLEGVDGLHLYADYHGHGFDGARDKYIAELIRSVHLHLVERGIRDAVTLMAGGGIIRPEHVAKALILGADLVTIDTAMLVALQALFEGEASVRGGSRIRLRAMDEDWGAKRLANLVNSWREQMIEVLSAMGMRDVRRLRGEVGRAMFNELEERDLIRYIGGELDEEPIAP